MRNVCARVSARSLADTYGCAQQKQRRTLKNREAARSFRERQRELVATLERDVEEKKQSIATSKATIEELSTQNRVWIHDARSCLLLTRFVRQGYRAELDHFRMFLSSTITNLASRLF